MKKRTVSILQKVISSLTAAAVIMANRMPILAAEPDITHDGITFRAWGDSTSETGFPTSGNYYLTGDIIIESDMDKDGNVNKEYYLENTGTPEAPRMTGAAKVSISSNLNLDLNGHTVTFNLKQKENSTHQDTVAIWLKNNATLAIYDSVGGGKITTTRQQYLTDVVVNEESGEKTGTAMTTDPTLIYCPNPGFRRKPVCLRP